MGIKKTRIVATLGPSSSSEKRIRELLEEGVNVFRINFSHGDHLSKEQTIGEIQRISLLTGQYPALLADLQGPKIRTGRTAEDKPVFITSGSEVVLTSRDVLCDERVISVDYPPLSSETAPGQEIMINDGHIRLRVNSVEREKDEIICDVIDGGVYSSRKGVNLPGVRLSIPSLTDKDLVDLEFILKNPIQYIALSFVRCADDITALREIVKMKRPEMKIIAKIEKPEATECIEEILDVSDGIMVARGDLGVEMSPADIPVVQKDLIGEANRRGKLVIVATQMLESMIEHPLPTRAESTDVANAIFDGTDAVMLSGETAVGKYPVEAVAMMKMISLKAEESSYCSRDLIDLSTTDGYPPHALAEASVWAARDLGGIPILLFTVSGDTAFYMAKLRNQSPVYAFSPDENVVKMLSLAWNITSFQLSFSFAESAEMQMAAEQQLISRGLIKEGELIAVLTGTTPVRGATNLLRVKKVGES